MCVLGRLHRFAEVLESGKPVTARSLADAEEISTKTVYRTIDFMRDQLNWNIESSTVGFSLVRPNAALCDAGGQ